MGSLSSPRSSSRGGGSCAKSARTDTPSRTRDSGAVAPGRGGPRRRRAGGPEGARGLRAGQPGSGAGVPLPVGNIGVNYVKTARRGGLDRAKEGLQVGWRRRWRLIFLTEVRNRSRRSRVVSCGALCLCVTRCVSAPVSGHVARLRAFGAHMAAMSSSAMAFSSASSSAVASMSARPPSIGRPCTICHLPPSQVTGRST